MVDTQHNSYSSSQGKIGIRLLIYYMWSTFMYGAERVTNIEVLIRTELKKQLNNEIQKHKLNCFGHIIRPERFQVRYWRGRYKRQRKIKSHVDR